MEAVKPKFAVGDRVTVQESKYEGNRINPYEIFTVTEAIPETLGEQDTYIYKVETVEFRERSDHRWEDELIPLAEVLEKIKANYAAMDVRTDPETIRQILAAKHLVAKEAN